MRSLLRTLASLAVLVAALSAGSSTALAAPPSSAATGGYTIDDEWCFDDVVTQYCFDVEGFVRYTATPDGRELVTLKFRNRTVASQNGIVVGVSDVLSIDRSIYVDGGQFALHSVVRTKAEFGGETCTSTVVFKRLDYEVVVDRWNVNCT